MEFVFRGSSHCIHYLWRRTNRSALEHGDTQHAQSRKRVPALAFYGKARSPPAQAFAVFQQRAALTLPSLSRDRPSPSGQGSVAQSESAQPETEVPTDPSPSTKGSRRGVRGRLAGRTGERWPACGHPTTLGGRNPQRMGSATQRGAGLDGGLVEVGVMCRMTMKKRPKFVENASDRWMVTMEMTWGRRRRPAEEEGVKERGWREAGAPETGEAGAWRTRRGHVVACAFLPSPPPLHFHTAHPASTVHPISPAIASRPLSLTSPSNLLVEIFTHRRGGLAHRTRASPACDTTPCKTSTL